jgi:hypothetical protein
MSDAVSTYRTHANWNLRVAVATPDRKDADVLRARARTLLALADRLESQEHTHINARVPER